MKAPLIVAEISANHNQSLELALQHIQKAKEIGAHAVKIQTYTPSCLTLQASQEHFQIKQGLWAGHSLYELYSLAHTPFEWHQKLFAFAKEIGITLFSTPFSFKALELLESLACPMYKIASFELTDLELITEVAKTKKPLVLSSGIATDEEIQEALEVCKSVGNENITLLKCTSSYPASFSDAHLSAMPNFSKKWGVKFGLSDHSPGFLLPVIATTLGATMIEKHFILNHSLGGTDSAFSLDCQEFQEMIHQVHLATQALGDPYYQNPSNLPQRFFSRSLFIKKPLKKGEILTSHHLTVKRPNVGLPPKDLQKIIGKKATRDLTFGEAILEGDFI